MKKRVLSVLTGIFFFLMLIGTFFHENVDAFFRIKVQVITVQKDIGEIPATILLDGVETKVLQVEEFFLLPKQAVKENQVYVVEKVNVPYGSYEVVRIKDILIEEEIGEMIKVKAGLSEGEQVVTEFTDTLVDGMRIVVSP